MTGEQLRKIASVLRSQEEEKVAMQRDLDNFKKEAEVSRAVLHMLKDDLLDVSEIESKIAEFNSNPTHLKNTSDFFAKTKVAGKLQGIDAGSGNAEQNLLASLQS